MKTIHTLAIMTTLALGTVAFAQPGGHGRGKLERLDTNKDGKITLAEMKSEAAQKFSELDTDKNGRVAKEEVAAHHEQMRAKWAEKRAAREAAGEGAAEHEGKCGGKHGGRFGGKHMGRFFEKMDTNADGSVDQQEFTQVVEKRFARMDENGDKVLSGAELEHRFHKHKRGGEVNGNGAAGAAPNAR
jgi:Ca2+-binding EF-hand superfamily protein